MFLIREGEHSGNKVLLNIDSNKIKEGGHSGNKVLFNISGSPHLRLIEIVAVLYALGLIEKSNKSEASSSSNASPASFKSARNAEELGGITAEMLIDKVIKPLALTIFRKVKVMLNK